MYPGACFTGIDGRLLPGDGGIGQSAAKKKAVDSENDKEGLEAAWEETVDAYANMIDAAGDSYEDELADLQLAWRNLEVTVGASLGSAPPPGSSAGLEQAWGNVKEAYEALLDVDCNDG